ncbi:MAG: hypothetical protein KC917_12205 [Candidatus Omnitrophica bacterium]|nr:hypothetical protein [Candidatus Omnitrophota bacterium]MCB9784029.1 hypothetical protein [Candidatus Omnitrophota bacterium]
MADERRRFGCFDGCIVLIVILIITMVVMNLLMSPKPREFYLENPKNLEDRKELINSVNAEIDGLLATGEEYPWGYAWDADALWPLDTLTTVRSIQVFYLEKERLPSAIDEIEKAGLISSASTKGSYALRLNDDGWKLVRESSLVPVAYGN